MNHRFAWVAVFGLAVALAVGAVGYNVGVSHGLAMAAPAAGAPGAAVPYMPYMWYRPWGFGFGPLFFLFVFFFLFRGLLWGGYYRRGWRHGYPDGGVPPRFEEWHRRAHEEMNKVK